MSPLAQLQSFAQKVYLTMKNRRFDDIDSEDGRDFLKQIIDWTNGLIDELELEVGLDGQPVDWWFTRESMFELATGLTEGNASVALASTIGRVITDTERAIHIKQGDSVVSRWAVVHPKDISNRTDRIVDDMCAVVGTNLVFSRAFNETEAGGSVEGDVILKIPRLTYSEANDTLTPTNIKALTMVQPQQLLVLGVAKNATLPDIVQGKLSPSFVQKYTNLLQGAIARSEATSVSAKAPRDQFGNVRGLY